MTEAVIAGPGRPLPRTPMRRLDTSSDEAKARVRRRYRAERRFKAYGLGALGITTTFLLILLADILIRGIPAFWQHALVLDVPVKAETIDPDNKRTEMFAAAEKLRSERSWWIMRQLFGPSLADTAPDPLQPLRAADFSGLARQALYDAFPGIEGRQALRKVAGLLSTGAGDELRDRVVADAGLVGTTVRTRVLLSANADLYLKGDGTPIEMRPGKATATPSAAAGAVTIEASGDAFAAEMTRTREIVSRRIAALRTEADRLHKRAGAAAATQVEQMRAEAAEMETRIAQASGEETLDERMPSVIVVINGGVVKVQKLTPRSVSGTVLIPLQSTVAARPDAWQIATYLVPESARRTGDLETAVLERLRAEGRIERNFNWRFFTAGDSREPELAGIRGALVGSALTLLVTLALCLPIGVMAAIYLEEFASKNRVTDLIEININNLAAVPSIVFGLLGLAVFLNFFNLPRSAPLVGGLVLALLVLPTIIIASRAALKAVPPSIKEAALGVGASHQQAVFHHVLPLAMPGIMTGTIIGMAHALGETAPLLMIGMVAFIVDIPGSLTSAATVLPVQVFLWSDLPEPAFKMRTAAAIIVLLVFLFLMNGLAIYLRKQFERRW
jgi:phosphate transport system permease protein